MTIPTAETSDASRPRAPINVWYVHPYAGGPGVGRFSRPYYLARNWQTLSIRATVICPTFHHLMDTPQQVGPKLIEGVQYEFVEARAYARNGFTRLANMADFTRALLRQAEELVARHGKPDAIIGSSPHPYMFLATHRLARRLGAISIFEVRDLWPLSLVELGGVNPLHPLVIATGMLEKYAYRRADHVVGLHPKMLTYMSEHGLSPDRWHYIPNGVDETEEARLDSAEHAYTRMKAWQEEGRFVAIYAGALGPPNNIDVLVDAADLLHRQGNDRIRILIVGRGELQTEIAARISQLGLEDRVALFPQVPKAHALALMETADAGYISLKPMPIFRFGISPNKLYDYMLARLPIVSAIEAANDPVSEGRCGITVKPGDPAAVADALTQFANASPAQLAEMGERGRAFVEAHHNYEKLARRYAELFSRNTAPERPVVVNDATALQE